MNVREHIECAIHYAMSRPVMQLGAIQFLQATPMDKFGEFTNGATGHAHGCMRYVHYGSGLWKGKERARAGGRYKRWAHRRHKWAQLTTGHAHGNMTGVSTGSAVQGEVQSTYVAAC